MERATTGEVGIVLKAQGHPLFLTRAFASVLGQSHENWVLYLISDDAAREAGDFVCRQYRSSFGSRLSQVHCGGGGDPMTKLLETTNAEFIAFHNERDCWRHDFLEQSVAFLNSDRSRSCIAVASDVEVITEHVAGDIIVEDSRQSCSGADTEIDFRSVLSGNRIPRIAMLLRQNIAARVFRTDAGVADVDDWAFTLRILMEGNIGRIRTPLALHHRGPSNSIPHADPEVAQRAYYINDTLRTLLRREPGQLGMLCILLNQMESSNPRPLPTRPPSVPGRKKRKKSLRQKLVREVSRIRRQARQALRFG